MAVTQRRRLPNRAYTNERQESIGTFSRGVWYKRVGKKVHFIWDPNCRGWAYSKDAVAEYFPVLHTLVITDTDYGDIWTVSTAKFNRNRITNPHNPLQWILPERFWNRSRPDGAQHD